jgi:hypothetical protein
MNINSNEMLLATIIEYDKQDQQGRVVFNERIPLYDQSMHELNCSLT